MVVVVGWFDVECVGDMVYVFVEGVCGNYEMVECQGVGWYECWLGSESVMVSGWWVGWGLDWLVYWL